MTADGIASKVLSTSSVVALLGSAAYEWGIGYRTGIAARLGIANDFVPVSFDPVETPYVIVLFVVIGSLLAVFVGSLVPAFTSWQIPALCGLFEIFLGLWSLLTQRASTHRWTHLLIGLGMLALAAGVAFAGRLVRRLVRDYRQRPRNGKRRKLARWIVRHLDLHLHPRLEGFLVAAQVTFIVSLLVFGAIMGAFAFGRWLGDHAATPSQAVVSQGTVYGWLGTTPSGLLVVRTVDFCGATLPEQARHIRVSGVRATLLPAEGVEVIRLSSHLRLVDHCP